MEQTITHTVLWIDDDVLDTLDAYLQKNGIKTIIKKCYKDGLDFLDNAENRKVIDAVILDVNCKVDENEKDPSAKSFRDCANKVYALCERPDKFIPWFVLTAGSGFSGAESLDMLVPERTWTLKQFYYKGQYDDLNELTQHIKQLTASAPNVALRNKYPSIWGVCHEKAEVSLLRVFEKINQSEQCTDTSIFVDMRAILAATVTRGKQCGLFPGFISKANEAKSILRTLSMDDEALVPLYISFNYAALCDTVNNGCHTEDEEAKNLKVHPDVAGGKAPYLINAAFFQLLTILKWFGSLSIGEKSVPKRKEQVNKILGIPAVGEKIYLFKDKNTNTIVYKKCLAFCKDVALKTVDLRNEFFFVEQIDYNTKDDKDIYPYFIRVSAS